METEPQKEQDSSQKPRKVLGKPSYMTGVGVARAFNAISGNGRSLPEDNLPLDELPLEGDEQRNDSQVVAAPVEPEATRSAIREENEPLQGEVKRGEGNKGTRNSTSNRSKPVGSAEMPVVKPKEAEKGNDTEAMFYTLRIGLSPEELLKLETFCFELRMKVIRQHKRKPLVGIQTLSQFFLKKLFRDKRFAGQIEEELIAYLGADKSEE